MTPSKVMSTPDRKNKETIRLVQPGTLVEYAIYFIIKYNAYKTLIMVIITPILIAILSGFVEWDSIWSPAMLKRFLNPYPDRPNLL